MSLSTYRIPMGLGLSLPPRPLIIFLLAADALEFAGFAVLKSVTPDFATRFAGADGVIPLPLRIHLKFDRMLSPIGGTYAMVVLLELALVIVLSVWKPSTQRTPQ